MRTEGSVVDDEHGLTLACTPGLRELARDVVLVRLAVVTRQVEADRGTLADLE